MPKQVVILSGRVCAGKTTLAKHLQNEHKLVYLRTMDCLCALNPNVERSRQALQLLGERLDRKTGGSWVRDGLQKMLQEKHYDGSTVVVDAARIKGQIDAIRESFGERVVHVHLIAPLDELEKRYKRRRGEELKELLSYKEVRANKTENRVDELSEFADVVIDTKRCSEADVLTRVACNLGLYGREYQRLVDVLVGGQYGSEGKGQVVAHLAHEYDVLVRVGGPNAGHTVYEKPKPYVFHHLPSGTRANPGARLIIGPGAVLYVPTLQQEINACEVEIERLSIDPQAMIISEDDRKMEAELKARIGSTAQGVGYATARKILRRGDNGVLLAGGVSELKPYIRDTCRVLENAFRNGDRVLLEGTQGTGLSIHHGKYPYVTSRDTTVAGCLAEAGISPSRVRKVIMVCRTYPIRVQSPDDATSGPMSQELSWKEISERSGISLNELTEKERTSTTRRSRRVSEFDWVLLRKAASLNAPTDVALTFTDYLSVRNREARRFEQLEPETIRFIEEVERVAAAPVSLISTRFHSRSIIDRRAW